MTKTPNFSFELVTFDKSPWGQLINDNWSIIDAVMAKFVAINNVKGVWQNATAVLVGESYIDGVEGTLYKVLVAHTTASSGLFSADRAKNTANWIISTTSVSNASPWAAAKTFSSNQFVSDGNRFGITTSSFTSSTTYDLDATAGNIITLADLTTPVSAAAASATAAAASAAGVNLPSIVALNYLRGLADTSGYEVRTPAQVLSDIGAQALDATLTALAGVTTAGDLLIYATGVDAFTTTSLTAAARTLLDDTTVAAMRTTLGLVIGTDVLPELSVVAQAEAEAGTATTERVWTAQRVKQAIAALETNPVSLTSSTVQATTSGSSVTFSSPITAPKRITIMFNEVSNSNAVTFGVQIGDAGGIETTGYVSTANKITDVAINGSGSSTTTFTMGLVAAADKISGQMVLTLVDSSNDTWVGSFTAKANATILILGGGVKSLSAVLTQIKILASAITLDNGSVNVLWE